jgi:hypothetical protein
MTDNLKKKDGRDKSKVNSNEPWEVKTVAKKLNVSEQKVISTIKKVGPTRTKVEAAIKKNK